MPSKIQFLDDITINQIAAGEVIENPASVIKELVENSLDAGATKIFVEIQGGGQDLIVVQDNGFGMSEEDVQRSIGRHATSKIRMASDLESLSTLGFRGEALAAIASISELTIRTKEREEGIKSQPLVEQESVGDGCQLVVHGGKIISCHKTTALSGTAIEVRALFYNVPARKKFQKAPAKDTYEVTKLMTQLALAHPEAEFDYIANYKKEFSLKACTYETYNERIAELLGKEFSSSAKPLFLENKNEAITIRGFIGAPAASRPTRGGQFLFINKRPISSLAASFAVKEAYGSTIEAQRHPSFVLHFTLDPELVDVNVHPQKKEVRFKKEEEIKKWIFEAVEKALFQTNNFSKNLYSFSPLPLKAEKSWPLAPAKSESRFFYETPVQKSPERDNGYLEFSKADLHEEAKLPLLQHSHHVHVVGLFQEYAFIDFEWSKETVVPESLQPKTATKPLFILNCKAALSRIAFDDLVEKKQNDNPCASQRLLVPFFIELAFHEAAFMLKILPLLKNMGLEIREFGKSAFLIEAIPASLEAFQLDDFIREIVKDEAALSDQAKTTQKLAQHASRTAGRRKYPITAELTREIVKRLLACKEPFSSPFGEKTFTVITKEELEKRFE